MAVTVGAGGDSSGVRQTARASPRRLAGNSRPASGTRAQRVYATNSSNLDRDKDGTACEN